MPGALVSLVLVVGVFAFVLPRVADYGDVWEAVSGLSALGLAGLLATAIVNLATFAPPWMAALPGLSFLHALVLSQASTAAASVLPGGDAVGIAISYSMLRRWGFTVEQVTVGSAATTVWNMFANVLFAVAAVAGLAISGESHPLLTTATVVGSVAVGVAIALFAVALNDDRNARLVGRLAERLWNGVGARAPPRRRRRAGTSGWSASAAATPPAPTPRSRARPRPSRPGATCPRRAAASSCGCWARSCGARRRRSARSSRSRPARSPRRASARCRR